MASRKNEDQWLDVARRWDKYSRPAYLNPRRIAFLEFHFTTLERYIKSLLDHLPTSEKAFEFGCGAGANLIYLIKSGKVGWGLGIDISNGALKGASALAKALDMDRRCYFKKVNYLDYSPNETYGIVLCIQFINYVNDLDSFFDQVSRMTDTTSTVLIHDVQRQPFSVYSFLAKNEFIRRLLRKSSLPSSENSLTYYKCDMIKDTANAHGFSVLKEHYAMPYFLGPILNILYHLSIKEFKNKKSRLLIKKIYIMLNGFTELLSKAFSNRKTSIWYYIMFRKA